MKAPEMPTILTIGHSNRTWKEFLELLRAHHVKRVIDIRSIPRSRHNPQFNRVTLSKKLRAARIGYVHLRKLGGLRHARRDSLGIGGRSTDDSCLRNERPAAADFARSAAPASRGNAAWIHDGEVHPRNRVHRGLQNHWPRPRRLAGRLPVFQPGGGDLIHEVCRFPKGNEDRN